jgi:sporulation protein YlmC with PRC-barrel domain
MRTFVRLAPVAALAGLIAAPVAAQQPPPSPTQPPPYTTQQPSPGQSTSPPSGQPMSGGVTIASDSLVGTKVRDAQGKELGEISRLMIDAKQGKIAAAVIKQGGTLGMGAKEISVPWEGLTLQRGQNQELVVTMQQEYLEQAPAASPSSGQQQRQQDQQRKQ